MPSCCSPVVRLVTLAASILAGCGGGGNSGHAKLEGPFAEIVGGQSRSFSLAPGKLNIVCKPKPGLKEFEFEAATVAGSDTGSYFRLILKDYTGPGDFELEYDASSPQHKIEVGVPAEPKRPDGKDYKYRFWYHLRGDTNVTYRSHCDLSLTAEEGDTKTHFVGLMSCAMLFADSSSADHDPGLLNSFVDLFVKFECDWG